MEKLGGDIEILVRKSTIGEAGIGHVQSACEWARKHKPIPIDFGTVLQGHMSIDDIKRVVGRCDKEELSETESEQIDHAKLKATRIMVDVRRESFRILARSAEGRSRTIARSSLPFWSLTSC